MGGRGSFGAAGRGASAGLSRIGVDVGLVSRAGGTRAEMEDARNALYEPVQRFRSSLSMSERTLNRGSSNPAARENVARHDFVAEDAPRRYAQKVNTAFREGAGEANFTARTVSESRSYWNSFFQEAVTESTNYARLHIKYRNGRIVRT